jgi:hypothetical protein
VSGLKSYCCKQDVPAFTKCKWYEKATHREKDYRWEPSCPDGWIKVAMLAEMVKSPGFYGEKAFCCEGMGGDV